MTREELDQKIRADLHEKGKIEVIGGVFGGETRGSDGYVEEVIKPPSGGTFTKLYGCTYLWKGFPEAERVHGIELAKSFLSSIPRELAKHPFIALGFILTFLFRRKRFYQLLGFLVNEIEHRVLKHYDLPPDEYNQATRELLRAVKASTNNPQIITGARFICLFLELDASYRFRVQDVIEGKGKEKPIGEFFRMLRLLEERETKSSPTGIPISYKWRFLRFALRVALWDRNFKDFLSKLIAEIDAEKVKMDENDWYFCLLFKSYNFRGIDFACREQMRKYMDKEKEHIFVV